MSKAPTIPAAIAPFVSFDASDNEERHAKLLEEFELFIKTKKMAKAKVARKYNSRELVKPSSYMQASYMAIAGLSQIIDDIETEIYNFETEKLQEIIDNLTIVEEIAKNNPKLNAQILQYCDDAGLKCAKTRSYRVLKKKLKSLNKKQEKIIRKSIFPNITSQIRVEMVNSLNSFNEDLEYCPPSVLDDIITEYLVRSFLAVDIEPTITIILNSPVEDAVVAINTFTQNVYEGLNIKSGPSQVALYYAVIRFLFNEMYPKDSELNKYNDQNALFLKKCAVYSHKSVRDLNLDPSLINGYTPGLPISSLFKSKQLGMMDQMDLMTNPLDLMFHVHFVVEKLANNFGKEGEFLAFDDTLTLLIALIAINPPANGYSIKEFISHWENLQVSPLIGMAKNYFVAAVDHLMSIEIDPKAEISTDQNEFF